MRLSNVELSPAAPRQPIAGPTHPERRAFHARSFLLLPPAVEVFDRDGERQDTVATNVPRRKGGGAFSALAAELLRRVSGGPFVAVHYGCATAT